MPQNHFRQFIVFATVLIVSEVATAVLFQSSMAASEEFHKYALQNNQQTYTQWFRDVIRNSTEEAHPQVLEFSQQALKEGPSKQVLSDWDLLRHSIDLNKPDREVFTLLAEKLSLKKELCRYILLDTELANILESPSILQNCPQRAQPLPQHLDEQLEPTDLLVVDGKIFTKSQLPQKLVEGTYHWEIISNRYEDRHFVGTAAEFVKQKFYLQAWVSGDCRDYKLNYKNLTAPPQFEVYFSKTCVNPGIPPEKTFSSWASEHKPLLWGLGILAAGLAVAPLKNKTLVVTSP